MKKLTINELLGLMNEQHAQMCSDMLIRHKDEFATLPGSIEKHQAWEGGLLDHIVEVMNIANLLFVTMNDKRVLPFSLSDALFVLFFHDFDKLERYNIEDGIVSAEQYHSSADRIKEVFEERWSYTLTPAEYNAFKYTHGEGDDYSRTRVMNELAAFVHSCDTISARIWYSYGKNKEEWGEESK